CGRPLRPLAEGLGQHAHIVVDGPDISIDALHATHHRRYHDRLRAGIPGEALRELQVVPGLDEDDPDALLLHQSDQLREMLRRRGDSRSILEHTGLDEPKSREEVDVVVMIDDYPGALDGLELPGPAHHRLLEAAEEGLAVLLEGAAKLRGDTDQTVDDVLRHDRRQLRIER